MAHTRLPLFIEQLWKAADAYERKFINGSAQGLVIAGALQRLPKCLAVAKWQKNLWSTYYQRKALLQSGVKLTEEMLNFSSVGPIPVSVAEINLEVVSLIPED